MGKEISESFLTACSTKQEARTLLSIQDGDPLYEKAKKKHKYASSQFSNNNAEVISKGFLSACPKPPVENNTCYESSVTPSFLYKKEKKIKKAKAEKKAKKRKKKAKQIFSVLDENIFEKSPRNANLLSEVYKNTQSVISYNNELFIYDEKDGCFHQRNANEVAADIKGQLPEELQLKIGSRDYKEAFDLIKISNEISADEGFFENKPYVNCINGVVDVRTGELLDHSTDFRFKHRINSKYLPGEDCPIFMEYVDCITGGDTELKKLLQVILGYLFSHYNNAKTAILIYGIPHTGKSVLCNVLTRIIGEEYSANIDLNMLSKPEYAASLSSKILNVAPDLRNEPLKEVGFFKSLVSHDDTITARSLYSNPTKIHCETKMVFSTNHLITFSSDVGPYDIEAVFNRLLYFPFQNPPIRQDQDNKHLSDDIYTERDAIFTWAMAGLRYYVNHNETFPPCKLSEEIKSRNMAQFCSEKFFFNEAIKFVEGKFESSSDIKAAYEAFCIDNDIPSKGNIANYIKEYEGIQKSKKRIDAEGNLITEGNPIYVYEGIRLKNKYRSAE